MPDALCSHLSTSSLPDNSRYRPRLTGSHDPCRKSSSHLEKVVHAPSISVSIQKSCTRYVQIAGPPSVGWEAMFKGFMTRANSWVDPHLNYNLCLKGQVFLSLHRLLMTIMTLGCHSSLDIITPSLFYLFALV